MLIKRSSWFNRSPLDTKMRNDLLLRRTMIVFLVDIDWNSVDNKTRNKLIEKTDSAKCI